MEIAKLLGGGVGQLLRLALVVAAVVQAWHGQWGPATFYLVLAYAGDEVTCKS